MKKVPIQIKNVMFFIMYVKKNNFNKFQPAAFVDDVPSLYSLSVCTPYIFYF